MSESDISQKSALRKRTRDEDENEYEKGGAKESVFSGTGGSVSVPEAKRINSSAGPLLLDADLMAFLERIDNMENYNMDQETEIRQEEKLCGVMKTLEEEIGLKQPDSFSSNGDHAVVADASDNIAAGGLPCDIVRCEYRSSGGDYNISAEFNFFLDTAEELAMNHFHCVDGDLMALYASSHDNLGYTEVNAEFYDGSLWEDDIWQLKDVNEIPHQQVR
eukprot:Gb_06371 [translate_table: standard]